MKVKISDKSMDNIMSLSREFNAFPEDIMNIVCENVDLIATREVMNNVKERGEIRTRN